MTIWAEQGEVLDAVVSPVTVDMFDLDGNFAGDRMFRIPSALAAFLAKTVSEIPADEAVAVVDSTVGSAFDQPATTLEFGRPVAGLRAI